MKLSRFKESIPANAESGLMAAIPRNKFLSAIAPEETRMMSLPRPVVMVSSPPVVGLMLVTRPNVIGWLLKLPPALSSAEAAIVPLSPTARLLPWPARITSPSEPVRT